MSVLGLNQLERFEFKIQCVIFGLSYEFHKGKVKSTLVKVQYMANKYIEKNVYSQNNTKLI